MFSKIIENNLSVKMNFFTSIFQGLFLIFSNTYFQLSHVAKKIPVVVCHKKHTGKQVRSIKNFLQLVLLNGYVKHFFSGQVEQCSIAQSV